MKKSVFKTFLFFSSVSVALMLPAGEIFPAPRSFQPEDGKMFPVPKAVEITGKSSFALEAAAEVLKNHLVAFPEHSSGAITLEVNADQLPEEDGYSWQMDPEKNTISIIANNARGAHYAVRSLMQAMEENGLIQPSKVYDYPEYSHRYFGDYEYVSMEQYQRLIDHKMNGFAMQHRGEWQDYNPSESDLATVAECVRRDELDFMFLYHLYSTWSSTRQNEQFSCSNPEHVNMLLDRILRTADAGVNHIMICVDDWTPMVNNVYVPAATADLEQFPTAAQAHAFLVNKIHDALQKDHADVELSLCPPSYSLFHFREVGAAEYLQEFHQLAHKDVMLVWTGPEICSAVVDAASTARYQACAPGRKLMLWDNSDGFNSEFPLWKTSIIPEAAHRIFLNTHIATWPALESFNMTCNAYLWNPAAYNPDQAFDYALADLYTPEAVPGLLEMREKVFATMASDGEISDRLAELLDQADAVGYPTGRIRWLISRVYQLNHAEVPDFVLPFTAELVDKGSGNAVGEEWRTILTMRRENGRFIWEIVNSHPDWESIPEPTSGVGSEEVFLNPELWEFFLQPNGEGRYLHFAFDMRGNRADEISMEGPRMADFNWDLDIQKENDQLKIIVSFPESELERINPARPGAVWRFNVFRLPHGGPILSLNQLDGSFHTVQLFPRLHFDGSTVVNKE